MISEFQDLSDKIDRLALLTSSFRSEISSLRISNASLNAENAAVKVRLAEVQRRLEDLLAKMPAPEAAATQPAIDDEAAQ